jgi:hypothetical protein
MYKVVQVNPGGTGLERVGDANGTLIVLGVNSGCEAVVCVVSKGKNFLFRLELGDCDDWAKDLFLYNLFPVSMRT